MNCCEIWTSTTYWFTRHPFYLLITGSASYSYLFHYNFICLQTIIVWTALHENALSLLNKKIIAVSWTIMATGTAIFNIVFELRFITKCYDIITIYHLPILSTAARDFSRMSPFKGTNPNAGALSWYSSLKRVDRDVLIALVFLPLPSSYASTQVKVAIGYAPSAVGFGFLPARFSSNSIPLSANAPASTDGFRNSPFKFWSAAATTTSSI